MKNSNHFTDPAAQNWFAVYTRYKYEMRIRDELNIRLVKNYLPVTKRVKKWSDRNRVVEEPVIPSYIFVFPREKEYYDILNIKGVINFVGISGKPSPIPLWQIEAIQAVANSGMEHSFSNEGYPAGEKVLIRYGPLKGMIGEIIEDNTNRRKLSIRISEIGYSLVIIERSQQVELFSEIELVTNLK
jgi:transcriptional antiterminator RfaH